jgi:hypothetical protein
MHVCAEIACVLIKIHAYPHTTPDFNAMLEKRFPPFFSASYAYLDSSSSSGMGCLTDLSALAGTKRNKIGYLVFSGARACAVGIMEI